jgi:hypothetical protein
MRHALLCAAHAQVDRCHAMLEEVFGCELRCCAASPRGKAASGGRDAHGAKGGNPTPTSVLQLEEALSQLPSSSLGW